MKAVPIVLFAPRPHASRRALVTALTVGVGPVQVARTVEEARDACVASTRAVLLVDLRGGGDAQRADAELLRRACPLPRCLAVLPSPMRALAGAEISLRPPVYLEELVRWCLLAALTPPSEALVADLAAGLSHEILNPLSALLLQIGLLKDDPELDTVSGKLQLIEEQARRIRSVVQDVVSAAERHPVQTTESTVSEFLAQTRRRLGERAPQLLPRLELHPLHDRPCRADSEQLSRALADVWEYLLRASGDGQPLHVETLAPDGRLLRLAHLSRAERLPPDAAARLFTPLWARQALGLPAGLSLTSARSVFRSHGGDLRARPQADGRLLVHALLPESRPLRAEGGP